MSSFELKKVALVVLAAFGAGGSLAETVVNVDTTVESGASVSYEALTITGGDYENKGNVTVTAGSVDVTGGTFANAGEFTVNQDFNDSTGKFSNIGRLAVNQLTLSGWTTLGGTINAADSMR